MRSNAMKSCAVGAMLFGGTLGTSSMAEAGLVFTTGGSTENYAYSYAGTFSNQSFSATTVSVGDMNIAWSATTTSGFSTTVTSSGDTSVYTARTFTVTGSQQITLSWSGSDRIAFAIVTGPDSFAPVSGLGAGWSTDSAGQSETAAVAGSVTVTLNAGNYFISNNLNGGGISGGASSFNFVVPAPGAVALLGAAGLVGTRRRRN